MSRRSVLIVLALCAVPRAHAAVTAAPGWAVHQIATPGTVQGGVIRSGDALFVGQGSFGVGAQWVIRIDAGGTTTVATGFNSLGGLDVDGAGTLWLVDNAGNLAGAATGDTLFAVPGALTRTTAATAVGSEVLPAGSVPFAMDALVVPGGDVLVADAVGFGAGEVVRVTPGAPSTISTFAGGLDFLGGLARMADGSILVANLVLDPITFAGEGQVLHYAADGMALPALKTGLSGAFGLAVDDLGRALVGGGFADDFSGTVVAIDAGGTVSELARGFAFTGELSWDATRREILVLDFGVSVVTAICRDGDGDGACDADDVCPSDADPAQTDTDGDGIGDACDPCASLPVAKPKVVIGKLATAPGDESLAFAARLQLPFPFVPALDPVAAGLHLVVEDEAGTVVDVTIPGGAFDPVTETGWKLKKGAFKWSTPRPGLAGIVAAKVKPTKTPGLVLVTVSGRNGSWTVDPADLPLRATVVLDAGRCGDALFPGPAGVAPTCAYDPGRGKVKCK